MFSLGRAQSATSSWSEMGGKLHQFGPSERVVSSQNKSQVLRSDANMPDFGKGEGGRTSFHDLFCVFDHHLLCQNLSEAVGAKIFLPQSSKVGLHGCITESSPGQSDLSSLVHERVLNKKYIRDPGIPKT